MKIDTLLLDVNAPRFHKFGGSVDIDTTVSDMVLDNGYLEQGTGDGNYTFQAGAARPFIASSDNTDTVDVTVYGLDASYGVLTETVTLTGQSPVQLQHSYLRMDRAFVSSSTEAAGWITCGVTSDFTNGVPDNGDDVFVVISPDHQQTMMLVYTVPANRTLIITNWGIGCPKGDDVQCRGQYRPEGGVFRTQAVLETFQQFDEKSYPYGLAMPAKADLRIRATSSTVNSEAYGSFYGILV